MRHEVDFLFVSEKLFGLYMAGMSMYEHGLSIIHKQYIQKTRYMANFLLYTPVNRVYYEITVVWLSLTSPLDQFNIFLRSRVFFCFFHEVTFFHIKINIAFFHKSNFFSNIYIFFSILSLDFHENSLEGESLWYLTFNSKFHA